MSVNATCRPVLVLDYEGTMGTSVERHYVQYVEALRQVRGKLGVGDDFVELGPISREEFLRRYPVAQKPASLLVSSFADKRLRREDVAELLQAEFYERMWQYRLEDMAFEKVIEGVPATIRSLVDKVDLYVVSYTRQDQAAFALHLERLGLVGVDAVAKNRVFTCGSDGAKSREAKVAVIREALGAKIDVARREGLVCAMVADGVDDLRAALDCGLSFIAVTETGKNSRSDFEAAFVQERTARNLGDAKLLLAESLGAESFLEAWSLIVRGSCESRSGS